MKLPALLFAAIGLFTAAAQAQTFPTGPITLVVPFAAGSGTDAVARVVAKGLTERLGQQVLVDNRAGASGQLAAQYVAAAKPDGYTLLMTTNTTHSANPSLFKTLRYDPIKSFTPIARVGELPFALVVNPALPVKTLPELIDYARAHPGKLSYGTPNSTSLVASETIKRIAGINMVGVPYKSSPQALTELIGGTLDVYVVDLGSGMAMIQAGKVRTLATTNADGTKLLPGVPPIGKTVKGFDLTSWNGIFAPAGTPRAVVDKLNAELQVVLADKAVQEHLAQIGFEVSPTKTPEAFAKYVADQLAHWTSLIQQAGIPAQ
ncbi:MAG TPA: tripartite tricarboxylate transporter substrate binding protein [Rubrivivax sp.]|nr:tripartite tricarboxylate transporter substrate binding protein [Rubrivivax sp.]HRY86653.1 tripartite tricarboxylate transporter substrate binding protein [Rubrivivax sp.]HRZ60143.1 tripartite tricarboxylate transporter substrate binding protein [Rubrivivax sp.]